MAIASANRAYPAPFPHPEVMNPSWRKAEGLNTAQSSPICFEPVASESEEIGESGYDESEVEERQENTDWYGLNDCVHPMLHYDIIHCIGEIPTNHECVCCCL